MSTEYPAEIENEQMRCPSCGAELPSQSAYCSKCGARASVEPRRCVNCGAELPSQSAYCSKCGARNELRVRYSLWRVGILTFMSLGFYYLYWMYVSWKNMAEEMPGKKFHPVWHTMSQFVPIYNLVVLYQHFRTIKKIQEREGLGSKIRPGLVVIAAVVAFVIWSAAERAASVNPHLTSYAPVPISLVIITMIVLQGQANLNKYWERLGERPVRSAGTGPGEVIIIAVGGLVAAVYVVAIIFLIAYTPPGESVRLGTIDVGSAYRGTIESHVRVDAYRFAVQRGTQYAVYVSPTTLGLDGDPLEGTIVALWDSDGTTILQVENADTTIVIPWTASSSGTRYVTVESDGTDLGDYVLRVDAR